MTEDDVVAAVAKHLRAEGWSLVRQATTKERGVDLIMARGDERFLLEAKGGTSTFERSARYEKGFTTGQQQDHVAKAVYKACKLRSEEPKSRVAIAFPDTPTHRRCVQAVAAALKKLSVSAYVVHLNMQVEQIL